MKPKREVAKQKMLRQRKNESRSHKQSPIAGEVESMKEEKKKGDAAEPSVRLDGDMTHGSAKIAFYTFWIGALR